MGNIASPKHFCLEPILDRATQVYTVQDWPGVQWLATAAGEECKAGELLILALAYILPRRYDVIGYLRRVSFTRMPIGVDSDMQTANVTVSSI